MGDHRTLVANLSASLSDLLDCFVPPVADRVRASWDLFALSERLIKRQHVDPSYQLQSRDLLSWGIGARAIKTFRAAIFLANLGHGPQATMLARSLIEDALTAEWVANNGDVANERFTLHERHTQHLFAAAIEDRELDLGELADLAPLSSEELKAMKSLFGPHGTKSWTGHSGLFPLYEDVRESWLDEKERYLLDHIIRIDLRYANLVLHNTSLSMSRPIVAPDGTAIYPAEESMDGVPGALLLAFWAYSHAIRHLLVGPYRDELLHFYQERIPMFFAS